MTESAQSTNFTNDIHNDNTNNEIDDYEINQAIAKSLLEYNEYNENNEDDLNQAIAESLAFIEYSRDIEKIEDIDDIDDTKNIQKNEDSDDEIAHLLEQIQADIIATKKQQHQTSIQNRDRLLRQQQDEEYAESLKLDKEKENEKAKAKAHAEELKKQAELKLQIEEITSQVNTVEEKKLEIEIKAIQQQQTRELRAKYFTSNPLPKINGKPY